MKKKFFTNEILIKANKDIVYETLRNPEYLIKWVPDIIDIKQNDKKNLTFTIKRNNSSFIPTENIMITEDNNTVIYNGVNEKLEYQLVFSLSNDENNNMLLQEDFYITKKNELYLPIKLLAPIMEKAFANNLNNFADFIKKMGNI